MAFKRNRDQFAENRLIDADVRAIHENRNRRRRSFTLIAIGIAAALVLFLPTIASLAGVGQSMLANQLGDSGWTAQAGAVRIGWITPLSVRDLVLVGPSGETRLEFDHVQTEHTILKSLSGQPTTQLGNVLLHGVRVETALSDGSSSIERDLQTLMQSSSDESLTTGLINIESLDIAMIDPLAGRHWKFSGGKGEVELAGQIMTADLEGVLTDPRGHGGQIVAAMHMDQDQLVRASAEMDSLPLSILDLITLRMSTFGGAPAHFDGDASGSIRMVNHADRTQVETDGVVIRGWQSDVPTRMSDGRERIVHLTNRSASIDGMWTILPHRIIAENCRVQADFATIEATASLPLDISAEALADPVQWLQQVDGNLNGTLDLVAFDKAVPGLLPLQRGAILKRAAADIQLVTASNSSNAQLTIRTTPIVGTAGNSDVTLDPMIMTADVSTVDRRLSAEKIEFQSSFGKITGRGELAGGELDFDLRLDQLASAIETLVDTGRIAPSGIARGQVRWANRQGQWTLRGNASATNFAIAAVDQSNAGINLLSNFDTNFAAVGIWDAQLSTLQWLQSASVELKTANAIATAQLTQRTRDPLSGQPIPIRFSGRGAIDAFYSMVPPSIRPSDVRLGGQINFDGIASVSKSGAIIGPTKLNWSDAVLASGDSRYEQSAVELDFDGELEIPSTRYQIKNAVLISPSMTAVARGSGDATRSNLDLNIRTQMSRLMAASVATNNANRNGKQNRLNSVPFPMRTVSLQTGSTATANAMQIAGDLTGDVAITLADGQWQVRQDLILDQFTISQRSVANSPSGSTPAMQTVWYEPRVEINGGLSGTIAAQTARDGTSIRTIAIEDVGLRGHWFQTTLDGDCMMMPSGLDIKCTGPTAIDMNVVAARLSEILKTPVAAQGLTKTNVNIRLASAEKMKFDIAGDLSWDAAEIGGVVMGPTRLPMHLTESEVRIEKAVIPVGNGRLFIGGVAHYQPGPIRIDLPSGRLAEHVELSPQMTSTWMKYLAPVVAGATNVSGVVSAELDGGTVYVNAPAQSQVSGRLSIERANMTAGEMVDRLLVGVDQARTLAGSLQGQEVRRSGKTLVTMPPQVVEFSMRDGAVQHDRMYFGIDRAEVVTSGAVAMDGRINMVAQIPIQAAWVGRDLGPLAGRPLTLPITGTLSRINVDTAAVGQLISQAVINAGQSEVKNYLDNQIGRGLEKLLGR